MKNKNYIFVKHKSKIYKIFIKDITHIEANGDYCTIFTTILTKNYPIHTTLHSLINYLPENTFCQTHRKYIVNIDNISLITDSKVYVGECVIPISNGHKKYFLDIINYVPTTAELRGT